MEDDDLIYVEEFIVNSYPDPADATSKADFKTRSYKQWAAYEILDRIRNRPDERPVDVICNFMLEMCLYASLEDNEKVSDIFQLATDVANEMAIMFV